MAYISQEDKKELAPAIKKVLKDFGMKGSISIRHHMSLVVTVTEGILDFTEYFRKGDDGHIQVNTYHIDNYYAGTFPSRADTEFDPHQFHLNLFR